MKAIVYRKYGPPDVLEYMEIANLKLKENEVLIRNYATTVTAADCLMRRGDTIISRIFLGLLKPKRKILGTEIAGEIEKVGKNVKQFKKGDLVYGFTGFRLGGYAEFTCLPENASLTEMPSKLKFEEAAAIVDGATTAIYFLKDLVSIKPGHKVLIIGASGSIGSYAVQIAKYFDAEVTAVCGTSNVKWVKKLGADHVIDYTQEQLTETGKTFDIIFDTVGKSSFPECQNSLKKQGVYLSANGRIMDYLFMILTKLIGGKKVKCGMSINKLDALRLLKKLVDENKIVPIIDRSYPLKEIIDAHRYVETGHKKGNIVIRLV